MDENLIGTKKKHDGGVNSQEEISEREIKNESKNYPEDIQKIFDYTGILVEDYDESIIQENDKDIDYYVSLIRSLYDMPYWKAVGTAEAVFGIEPSKTEEEVVLFIDEGSQRGFESLFEPFFWDDYNDPETIEYARSLAYYLTEYAVDNYSYSDFLSGNYREEWLKKAGSTSDYIHDDYNMLLENAEFDVEDSIHTISIGRVKWICNKAECANDAVSLYDMIYDSHKDFDAIESDIMTAAPEWYEAHKFPSDIWIEFYDDNEDDIVSSYTNHSRNDHVREITLSTKSDVAHEYVHALTSRSAGTDLRWLKEGVAELYSTKYSGRYMLEDPLWKDFLLSFNEEELDVSVIWDNYEPDIAEYRIKYYYDVKEKYDEIKSSHPSSYNEYLYFCLAVATLEMERDEVDPKINYRVAEVYESSYDYSHGQSAYTELDNRISYEGAIVLTAMLIKEFGADTVLEYLHTGGNFKRRFGMISEEYYQKVRDEGIDYSVFF